jgi:hypothetical protein
LSALDSDAISAHLDSLLYAWHLWQRTETGHGYNTRALVCGDYRTSRQYDDENGALDSALEHLTLKAVDFHVLQMADPYKAAIYACARNLVTGVAAWSSPRLPAGQAERAAVTAEARDMLARRLQSAGIL